MGYYTNFSLEIMTAITRAEAKDIVATINRVICPFIGNKDAYPFSLYDRSGIEDDENATWGLIPYDMMKWYDWEKDMKDIASRYPEIEFKLEGHGEKREDWWVALFKGSRSQIKYCTAPISVWEDNYYRR